MKIDVAELELDHRHALEVVADHVFLAHPDAAVELNAPLADEASRARDLHLRRRECTLALGGRRILEQCHRSIVRYRTREFELDEHVHRVVLERLERSDRYAELLARLQVLNGLALHDRHVTDGLCRERSETRVDDAVDEGQAFAELAEDGLLRHADAIESQ